jgi:hypothetical protein
VTGGSFFKRKIAARSGDQESTGIVSFGLLFDFSYALDWLLSVLPL